MRMPNSLRKHIRREKARIRKEVLDPKEQKEQIIKLREKNCNNSNLRINANDTNDIVSKKDISKKEVVEK